MPFPFIVCVSVTHIPCPKRQCFTPRKPNQLNLGVDMTTIAMPSVTLLRALDALSEALEDCEADNSVRAFENLKRAERLLTAALEIRLVPANG